MQEQEPKYDNFVCPDCIYNFGNSRRWQLVTLALLTCKFWTKLFQFKAIDARFQFIQNLNPNLVLWVKNTAFASNQLAMSKVFVKATFVSGTFDGKSLSLELPLPPFLPLCRCHAVSFDFCTAVHSFTQFLSWPKHALYLSGFFWLGCCVHVDSK